jgi:hypothetical protein
MSHALIGRWQGRLRRRRLGILFVLVVPVALGAIAVLQRWAAPVVVGVVAGAMLAGLFVAMVRRWRAIDDVHVVRALDSRMAELQDSSDLLRRPDSGLTPLQRLQRTRILASLDARAVPDLRRPWPVRGILLSLFTGALLFAVARFWPPSASAPPADAVRTVEPAGPATTVLRATRIDIAPPAYTGLSERKEAQLDVRAVEGARLRWSLQFDPPPQKAHLQFHDGSELALVREGDAWTAQLNLDRSLLYRLVIGGAPALAEDRLHRLDAVPDRAPELRVLAPEKTLNQHEPGQTVWELDVEVSDDFGVGGAHLDLTLAQGSGEQVAVSNRRLRLRADPGEDPRRRRFRHRLDLTPLGLGAGDDLIVHVEVADNRLPKANVARSAAYILRWPLDAAMASDGVEGIVQKVLPAYFRSQRQIIIDTEALIAEQPALSAERFLERSDGIGVDQKILRLRYGQFLGEEFESGRAAPAGEDAHDDAKGADRQDALQSGSEHAETENTTTFGRAEDVLEAYGHTHDHAEAATLLDPQTRKLLKSALNEMWQAELHLRQGEPRNALPYENRALRFIKQVQQSTRIYLARVGLELPPVDPGRRLSGKRDGLRDPRAVLEAAALADEPLRAFYLELSGGTTLDIDALVAWIRAHEGRLEDPLGLIAAVDAFGRDPACASCRRALLDRLWSAMPARPARIGLRVQPDALGETYLDALDAERPR